MGDEDKAEPKVRLSQRRNKIIINRCKKLLPQAISKPTEDPKKVNIELFNKNKSKDLVSIETVEDETPKELDSVPTSRPAKRKPTETGKDKTSSVEFKGFKKRILAQTEKLKDDNIDNTNQDKNDSVSVPAPEAAKPNLRPRISKINKTKKKAITNGKKGSEGDKDENQAESQAEYAQYLGLKPTMQLKCYRCGEKGFPTMLALNMHQRGCGEAQKSSFITNLQSDTILPSDPNMLTNFRITRKVYLCSACGTYYEHWNIFLHMRDVHKKYICLFCLTMFATADKLADHLKTLHKIQESTFKSSEEFQNSYKDSCYLICCTCENMFDEREDYFHHHCIVNDPTAKCPLCGVKCGHNYTCPNSNTPRALTQSLSVSNHPMSISKAQSATLTKYNLAVSKNNKSEELWMGKKTQGLPSSDNDEDYDISYAASFCHIDIGDGSRERDKSGTEESPIVIRDDSPIPNTNLSIEEEKEPSETLKQSQEENNSTKTDSQPAKTIPEKMGPTVEQENQQVAPKNVEENGKEDCSSKVEDTNNKPTEEEQLIKDSNVNSDKSNDEIVERNLSEESISKEFSYADKEMDHNDIDEPSKEPDQPSDSELKEDSITTIMDVDETSNANAEMRSPPQNNKDASMSSDTDEPVTHLSGNQEDSDSSSDESHDDDDDGGGGDDDEEDDDDHDDKKKTDSNLSVELNKDNSSSDSDDSDKSGLEVDEKPKELSKVNSEDNKNNSDEALSEETENFPEEKSSVSDEISKDFHIDTDPSTDKHIENANDDNDSLNDILEEPQNPTPEEVNDGIPLAGEDVLAMALTLEDKLENTSSQSVVKECVRTSCLNCVYCSHAIKIAVNGKQLALHLLAEHRYKPIKNNETSQDVIKTLKNSLNELESVFFNTDSYDSSDKSLNTTYDYTYECFQCRFVTKVHKELYVHQRKIHKKTVLLCVMCKANFYTYSEMLCHMCPGIYAFVDDLCNFRCCFCNLDMIPSAFRLMVHLRKSHHTCDICLEIAGDQQKLSTHMRKHKLNHLCYRCGIAYRNKPVITKHLFWKHGTESVLCKKCLQKKWPHVYHFCIPPTVFICEECNASFTKAVALKVHKRFHGGEFPYCCSNCDKKFVSKKLLSKHEDIHNQLSSEEKSLVNKDDSESKHKEPVNEHINIDSVDEPEGIAAKDSSALEISKDSESKSDVPEAKTKRKKKKDRDRKEKPILDVYDLPNLNHSSESNSSDEEIKPATSEQAEEKVSTEPTVGEKQSGVNDEKMGPSTSNNPDESPEESLPPVPIVDRVWDNFQSYKAELEKRKCKDPSLPNILPSTSTGEPKTPPNILPSTSTAEPKTPPNILPSTSTAEPKTPPNILPSTSTTEPKAPLEPIEEDFSIWALIDHNYCLIPGKPKQTENEETEPPISETASVEATLEALPEETPAEVVELPIRESDLDTDESSTDEDFYDKYPQSQAKQQMENRNLMLLASVALMNIGTDSPPHPTLPPPPPPPSAPPVEETSSPPPVIRRKIKTKRRRRSQQSKKSSSKTGSPHQQIRPSTSMNLPGATSTPVSLVSTNHHNLITKVSSPLRTPIATLQSDATAASGSENESARFSKRKRVRNTFYGYSSEEEEEQEQPSLKWRKVEPAPSPQLPSSGLNFQPTLSIQGPQVAPLQIKRPKQSESSESDEEEEEEDRRAPEKKADSSNSSSRSSSSESENEVDSKENVQTEQSEKSNNLYCYCQCPYDEVSDMIACDGQDCTIEWFHFECVGIMVPPKGKWYCPNCR